MYGSSFYVTNQYSNSMTVHNLSNGAAITSTVTGSVAAPNAVAVTPNGSQIYVTNANTSTVWALKTSNLSVEAKIKVGTLPTAVAISSNCSTVYVTNGYGYSVTIVNASNNTVKQTLNEVGIYPVSVAL